MLELRSLSKEFEYSLYENVNICLPNTGLYLLKGNNGSGKSTLLRIIAGLDLSYSGDMFYNEEAINKNNASDYTFNHVSYLSQRPLIIPSLSVIDNVLYPYYSKNKELAMTLLERLGLSSIAKERASSISKGEAARLALARGLFKNPDILLLDEATANLDDESLQIFNNILIDESKNRLVIVATNSERDSFITENSILIENKSIRVKSVNDANNEVHNSVVSYGRIRLVARELSKHRAAYILLFIIGLLFTLLINVFTIAISPMDNSNELTQDLYLANTNAYMISNEYEDKFENNDIYHTNNTLAMDYIRTGNNKGIGEYSYGIVIPNSYENIALTIGSYPAKNNEILISDYALNSLASTILQEGLAKDITEAREQALLNGEIRSMSGFRLRIVGAYKPFGKNIDRYKLLIDADELFYGRLEFGFGIDTIFANEISNVGNKDNKTLIARGNYSTGIIDKEMLDKNNIEFLALAFEKSLDDDSTIKPPLLALKKNRELNIVKSLQAINTMSYVGFGIYIVYLIIYLWMYIDGERKRMLLCRALGASRRNQIFSKAVAYGGVSILSLGLGYSIFFIIKDILSKSIAKATIGVSIELLSFNPLVLMSIALISIIGIVVFMLVLAFYLSPKSFEARLSLMEGGND